jgi:hypothetical protein
VDEVSRDIDTRHFVYDFGYLRHPLLKLVASTTVGVSSVFGPV